MLHNLWNSVLYKPLVNILAFFVSIIPGGNVGLAVILLTFLVKTALAPLSHRSIQSQAKMKLLEPEIAKIKASGASKEEQAKKTFELYKLNKTNPFSGCLLVLIQIPIILALYYVFFKFNGTSFDSESLYSFIHFSGPVDMNFLGIDLAGKSLILAVIAGISQFFQAYFMPKPSAPTTAGGSFGESFAKSMQIQMKYVFPILITFIAYKISGAIALYWITSNVFTIFQQIHVNRKNKNMTITVK